MFYAFDWFEKQPLFAATRATVLNWLKSQELLVFLDREQSTTVNRGCISPPDGVQSPIVNLEKRRLVEEDFPLLEQLIDNAWNSTGFGGYTAARHLADVNGLALFRLDEMKQQARLVGLIMQPELEAVPPLQSPVLYLALLEMSQKILRLDRLYLPFAETSQTLIEDRAMLALCNLTPMDELGWWHEAPDTLHSLDSLTPGATMAATNWLELSVRANAGLIQPIRRLFARYGYRERIVIERPAIPRPDGGLLADENGPATLRTYLLADEQAEPIAAKMRETLGTLARVAELGELQTATRDADEWADLWDDFNIHRVGRHLVISLMRQDYKAKPNDVVIEIVPSTWVFGPDRYGLHPTTKICLQLLEERIDPVKHHSILDLGTGTGILAIATAKLGGGKVLALDANQKAVDSARQNVALNELDQKITVETGSLAIVTEHREDVYVFPEEALHPPAVLADMLPFDVILANTISDVVIGLAEPFSKSLRTGGLLISSGISKKRAEEVAAALEAAGLWQLEEREDNNWVAFVHTKPENMGSL